VPTPALARPATPPAPAPVATPAPEASTPPANSIVCGSGLSIAERIACAESDLEAVAEAPAKSPKDLQLPAQPAWLDNYAAINGIGLPATAPNGAPEPEEAAPIVVAPGDPPRPAPPALRGPLIKPANAKVTALVDSGKRAAVKGDLDRAVHDFTEAIRIDPKYPDSYSERGQAMFKLGETERAIADYTAAIKRDPQHGSALRSRGMAYLYRGTPDLALADLTKAIELGENDPSLMAPIELFYARRSRASILATKQQYDREIADYTSLIESYRGDPMVVEALKANYGDVGAANILATVYRQRATAHIRRQTWDLAIADLTEAVPLSSDNGYTALVDRSKIYEGLGQREPAIADLQSALGVRPGSEEVRLALRRLGATSKPATPIRGL
jgi:tetratricopeptide (TPR) repeat protein